MHDSRAADILQWNARNLKSNQAALEQYITQHSNFKILAITETHLQLNEPFQFHEFVVYRADRLQRGRRGSGGAALLLRPDIPARQIFYQTQLEVVAVEALIAGRVTTVASVYVPPGANKQQEIRDFFSQLHHPAIICGDLNAHSTSWGATTTNPRGRCLENAAHDFGFSVLNDGRPTLRPTPRTNPTSPDTTLVSDQLINTYSWNVQDTTLGSDHYVITITIPSPEQSTVLVPPPPQRKFHKANWTKYTDILTRHSFPSLEDTPLDAAYEDFTATLHEAAAL